MNSEKTQISRRDVSAPTKWLLENYRLWGKVLHFGEGKAYQDTEALWANMQISEVIAYDPYSAFEDRRELPSRHDFDFGISNYVLNTLLDKARTDALMELHSRCNTSIITVRTDSVNGTSFGDGVLTAKDTFQTQLTAAGWMEWFHNTFRGQVYNPTINILNQTGHYLMIVVY